MTFIGLLFVHGLSIFSAISFSGARSAAMNAVCITLAIIGFIITVAGRVLFVGNHKGHLAMFSGVALGFLDMMSTNVEFPYVFGITFLIYRRNYSLVKSK